MTTVMPIAKRMCQMQSTLPARGARRLHRRGDEFAMSVLRWCWLERCRRGFPMRWLPLARDRLARLFLMKRPACMRRAGRSSSMPEQRCLIDGATGSVLSGRDPVRRRFS